MKNQPREMFTNLFSDMGLLSNIYQHLTQLNSQNTIGLKTGQWNQTGTSPKNTNGQQEYENVL